jgi:hypothetical protein
MVVKSRADAKKERAWRSLLDKWKVSGLSQAEFCRRESLKDWKFSFWKSKLARKGKKAGNSDKDRAQRQVEFAPVRVVEAEEGMNSNHGDQGNRSQNEGRGVIAEIAFGGGYVRVFAGADLETLSSLLTALKE